MCVGLAFRRFPGQRIFDLGAGFGVRHHRLERAIPVAHPVRRLRHQPERPREEAMKRTGHIAGAIICAAAVLAATSAIAQTPNWTVPLDGARCPSKWGAADERGAGNLMGPKSVLNAVKLIKTGEVIELSHVLHEGMPISRTRRYEVFTKRTTDYLGTNRRGSNEELVVSEIVQVGTQFDGFAHQTHADSLYNCFKLHDIANTTGVKKLRS